MDKFNHIVEDMTPKEKTKLLSILKKNGLKIKGLNSKE
jgi:hypothetical protein